MKKLLFIAMLALGFSTANAQEGEINLGANIGIPTGSFSDFYSFGFSIEANYLFDVADKIKVGPSIGYNHILAKKTDDLSFSSGDSDLDAAFDTSLDLLSGFSEQLLGQDVFGFTDASFVPIAIAGRFEATDKFILGLDMGYGIGLSKGSSGGFYYRPLVGYNVSEKIMAQLAYSGFSVTGGSISMLTLGVVYGL